MRQTADRGKWLWRVLIASLLLSLGDPMSADAFTVDDTGDLPDAFSDGICSTTYCPTCPPGPCTLRAAIGEANSAPGSAIGFNISGTIVVGSPLTITADVTINGPATISGNGATRAFEIFSPAAAVTMTDLTIQDGSANDGGGIWVDANGVSVVLTNPIFKDNDAAQGGAISIQAGGSLAISNGTFTDNEATAGGGAIFSEAQLTISGGTTFTTNKARLRGGAIYSRAGGLQMTGGSFTGNTVGSTISGASAGGAIDHASDALTLSGVSFSGNTAGNGLAANSEGGAVRSDPSTLAISGCTFTNGTARSGGALSLRIGPSVSATIDGSSFANNTAAATGGARLGGAIACPSTITPLVISDSTFTSNGAGAEGGAINCDDLDISGSTFDSNTAETGGAIVTQNLTMSTSTLTGNSATAGLGGAIAALSSVTIDDSSIASNTATGNGGGIAGYAVQLLTTTVDANQAGGDGGGIFCDSLSASRSTVSGNSASGFGGGAYLNTGTVSNSTFSGNSAGFWGGGMDVQTQVDVSYSTCIGNTAGNGGCVYNDDPGTVAAFDSSIVVDNTPNGCAAPATSNDYNVDSGTSCQFIAANDLSGVSSAPLIDPLLAANGGPTETHALLLGSAAIDTANPSTCPTVDERGLTRPQMTACDRGAFEFNLCGNGTLDPGELCDDGNFVSGDGCDWNCTPTGCGNGVVTPPEECDDGNTNSGDGCSVDCLEETPTPTPTSTPTETPTPTDTWTPTETATPEPTPTDTWTPTFTPLPTDTPTPTPPGGLDHFTCYKVKHQPPIQPLLANVTLADRFDPSMDGRVVKQHMLCAPTNKNGEDLSAPTHPIHLQVHKVIDLIQPQYEDVLLHDQFGDLEVDVGRLNFILVPAHKTLAAPAPTPPAGPPPDHFLCRRLRKAGGGGFPITATGVTLQDQFGSSVTRIRPDYLCSPVNKNNEDSTAPQHPDLLTCYKTLPPPPNVSVNVPVWTGDQFGTSSLVVKKKKWLCVPSRMRCHNLCTLSGDLCQINADCGLFGGVCVTPVHCCAPLGDQECSFDSDCHSNICE